MYSYLADANDVFRDINVAELDKDTNQARIFLKRASLDFLIAVGTTVCRRISFTELGTHYANLLRALLFFLTVFR